MGKYVNGESQNQRDVELHSIDKIDIYELTKGELDGLKDNRENEIYLSVASFCGSAAITLWITHITCDLPNDTDKATILALAIAATIVSIAFAAVWWIKRGKSNEIYNTVLWRKGKTKRIAPK